MGLESFQPEIKKEAAEQKGQDANSAMMDKRAAEEMTPEQRSLSREREQLLQYEKDPIKLARLVESVTETSAPAPFQRKFIGPRGNEVGMGVRDIQAPVNYLINMKEEGKWISTGSAEIRLNRGLISKAAGSEFVRDDYVGTSGLKWHTPDKDTLEWQKAIISEWVLRAPLLKRLLDHEQKGGPM